VTIGLGVFIACTAVAAALAMASCILTARSLGRAPAAKEGAVLALSLGAWVGVCLWLGFGIGAQVFALVISAVPLRIGRRYLTPRYDYLGGN
jgi:hypothetical protein